MLRQFGEFSAGPPVMLFTQVEVNSGGCHLLPGPNTWVTNYCSEILAVQGGYDFCSVDEDVAGNVNLTPGQGTEHWFTLCNFTDSSNIGWKVQVDSGFGWTDISGTTTTITADSPDLFEAVDYYSGTGGDVYRRAVVTAASTTHYMVGLARD